MTLSKILILVPMILSAACTSAPAKRETSSLLTVKIHIKHISKDEWRANYQLDQPVKQIVFAEELKRFHEKGLQFTDPAYEIRLEKEKEVLLRKDRAPFSTFELNFNPKVIPPEGAYPASIVFSDGGIALNSIYFALDPEPAQTLKMDYSLETIPSENVLVNGTPVKNWSATNDYDAAYFYFGTGRPAGDESLSILADPNLPAWLKKLNQKAVPEIFRFFEKEFLQHPKTFVMIRVKDLDNRKKSTLGGSAFHGGILADISGADWKKSSREFKIRFLSLLTHEGMHRFQGQPSGHFLPRAWLMEGGAEFFKQQTLFRLGHENISDVRAGLSDAANKCVIILSRNEMVLRSPALGDSFNATYFCGHVLHYATHSALRPTAPEGMFALWRKMFGYAGESDGSIQPLYYFRALQDLSAPANYVAAATKFISVQHKDAREAIGELLRSAGVKFTLRPSKNKEEDGTQFEIL